MSSPDLAIAVIRDMGILQLHCLSLTQIYIKLWQDCVCVCVCVYVCVCVCVCVFPNS